MKNIIKIKQTVYNGKKVEIKSFNSFASIENSYKKYYCIICFDRPWYLTRLIESLELNEDPEACYVFFQDGYSCFRTEEVVTDPERIDKSINCIKNSILKNKILFLAEKNYGPAKMRREAYRIIFDNSDISFATFMEEDISVGKSCFSILDSLEESFREDSSVFAISPFNKYQAWGKEPVENVIKMRNLAEVNLDHITLIWGLWKEKYQILIKDFDRLFYRYFSNFSYRKEIFHYYQTDFGKLYGLFNKKFYGASDDCCMAFCMVLNKMYKLSSKSNQIYYNGEWGIHGTPENFKETGLHKIFPDNIINTKKFKIDTVTKSRFDNYLLNHNVTIENEFNPNDILLIE